MRGGTQGWQAGVIYMTAGWECSEDVGGAGSLEEMGGRFFMTGGVRGLFGMG